MKNKILVTGGAGYIGSHTTLALLEAGFQVVVFDSLVNSSPESLKRIQVICGKAPIFIQGDIRDQSLLYKTLIEHEIESVLHFAGLKAVGESVEKPLEYYSNNIQGTLSLCQAMAQADVYHLVFSSSATVYGIPKKCLSAKKPPPTAPLALMVAPS